MNRIILIAMLFLSANVFSHQSNDVPELWSVDYLPSLIAA